LKEGGGGGGGGGESGVMTKLWRMLVRLEAALKVLWLEHEMSCNVVQRVAECCRVSQCVAVIGGCAGSLTGCT